MQGSLSFEVASQSLIQLVHLDFTPDDEHLIRSSSCELLAKIIDDDIDLTIITQTII
jgi:hypothetical protein